MNIFYLLGAAVIAAASALFYYFREKNRRESAESQLYFIKTELQESKNKGSLLEEDLRKSNETAGALRAEKASFESSIREKETAISERDSRISEFERQVRDLNSRITENESRLSGLNASIEQERKGFQEKLALLDEAKNKLGNEFENLGNKIFEDTTKKFTDKNKVDMETLLNPLREQIRDFERKVSDTHKEASTDMASLKVHIENLKNLGEQMSSEAVNLTTTLKGESQTQGAWGEVVLERTLEMSGLSEGREYHSQSSHKGEDGNLLRPDVIVRLPEGKDIVIDSKVSLTAYERYVSCENEEEREDYLKQHVVSFQNHIRGLSGKKYENIPEITSLNYVLMFVPLESAFVLTIETERDLFCDAFEKNVIIVCPSTLLATLRTVHSIWQFERQNANAREIARKAGKMHDKFVTFTEHLEEIRKHIKKSDEAYSKAVKSLSKGKDNLVGQARSLKELGVKTSKEFSSDLSEKSELSEFAVSSGKDTDDGLS